jgi:hypothetical protein
VVAGIAVAAGAFPAGASGALATGVFPADVYFDLDRSLSTGGSWSWVLAAMLLSVLVRGGVLASFLWLAGDRSGPLITLWARASLLVTVAWLALLPSVAFAITGSAFRYTPFILVGAVLGVAAAVPLVRKALRLTGEGAPGSLPGVSSWLGYVYLVAVTAFVREWLDANVSLLVVGLVVFMLALLHGVVLLKWHTSMHEGAKSGRPIVLIATSLAVLLLFGATFYDRSVSDPAPAKHLRSDTLYVLGGADSTSKTGALSHVDVRSMGWRKTAVRVLSYREGGGRYVAKDTHGDLSQVAAAVEGQFKIKDGRVAGALLGHSQAALIVDRILAAGDPVPAKVAVVSPPLPYPPRVHLPSGHMRGPGAPAGAVENGLDRVFHWIHLPTLDLDAPAVPTNLKAVVVPDSPVDRLAVWALADSVWLDRDWRRPGEANIVVLSDHVGAVKNARTVAATRRFFEGGTIESDDRSWRGALVNAIRYTFQPWRP